ncbi:HAMP domain-containing sensor histidine kinase [Caballeronia sp. LZ032]|uniref:sensor histidine kinase n=1 Tax=Caballeronia sp. LZ032 TaxID=3038565 RepID=UPI00285FB34A|nr:HAMP domain-containing sensor histidine kinase [Caballeronia sp. LZ032]MDR5882112.1 HAMP domain-containing sensor histidine kinase [Caballeronia sp. LZ032]
MDQATRKDGSNVWAAAGDLRIFERLLDPYLILDSDGAVVSANAAWRTLFAFPEGAAPDGLLAEQRRNCEHLIVNIAASLRAGQRRSSPVFRLDGGRSTDETTGSTAPAARHWQIFAQRVPATQDLPSHVVLRFEDVTARTLAGEGERREKAQMRSNARLRKILVQETQKQLADHLGHFEEALAFAGVGAWELDLMAGTVKCSERCRRDLGQVHADELMHASFLGDTTEQFAAHWRLLQSGQPFEFERLVERQTGRRWVLVRGMARFDDDVTVRSVVGFTLDITGRKEREIEAHAVAGEERSGRERSEALAATMDRFIAAVSHELRSPLNAIVSWAELLQLVADPNHVAKAGDAIRRNGRQLSRMVDDLLDSGAVVTGKLSANLKPIDIGPLVAIVVEDMRKLAEHKGLQLDIAELGSCVVLADENRLGQVVSNLLTNAIKFTDAGSVTVSMNVLDDHVSIQVRDTGRGIEPEALPRIFDRFEQIAPRTSGRVGGLGLGLWLARQIVDLHGGMLDGASDGAGLGSTFTVRLPLMQPGGE